MTELFEDYSEWCEEEEAEPKLYQWPPRPEQVTYWKRACSCKSNASLNGRAVHGSALWTLDFEAPLCQSCKKPWRICRAMA